MISLKVNGIPRSTERADATLYDFLRNELRLKGVRDAGDNGESGSAAVIVNGTAVNSCAVKMKDLENARVETVDYGIAREILTERYILKHRTHPLVKRVRRALPARPCIYLL